MHLAPVRDHAETLSAISLKRVSAIAEMRSTLAFAGRKFYPHQLKRGPIGEVQPPPAMHYDLAELDSKRESLNNTAAKASDIKKFLCSDQASMAVRVSKEGRTFGFAVRFKDLRPWELAALVAVLEPQRVAVAALAAGSAGRLKETAKLVEELRKGRRDQFGHKLGHGRPLGMGSVEIRVKHALRWPNALADADSNLTPQLDKLISQHFVPRLNDLAVRDWLKALQLFPDPPYKPDLLQNKTPIERARKAREDLAERSRTVGFAGLP